MKVDVICDWDSPLEQIVTRGDGFIKALEILGKEWDINFYRLGEECILHLKVPVIQKSTPERIAEAVLADKPDVILFFRDFTSKTTQYLMGKGIPMAICLTGGKFRNNIDAYDLVFVESEVYKREFEQLGKRVIKAFGVDTDLFKPIQQPKIWDAIFPATFANWKRHSIFTEAMSYRGLACGWMYSDHEQENWQICQEKGTMILPHLSHKAVAYLMNAAKTCVITSDSTGGSQRTVLEAMACNIPVIAMHDSDKTTEYVRDCGVGEIINADPGSIIKAVDKWKDEVVNTREWVIENYSAEVYADKLKQGLLSLCPEK